MTRMLIGLSLVAIVFSGCTDSAKVPTGVKFHLETLKRFGIKGDNWCITWAIDGSQITSMDDGNWLVAEYWLKGGFNYHNRLYRVIGDADDFTAEEIQGYPHFTTRGHGWFGYGVLSVNGNIYSMISRTPGPDWSGPFQGMKMLKSPDNGETWFRVNRDGRERLLKPWDEAREDSTKEEMFFLKESGVYRDGVKAYPFSYCSFVQNGQDNSAARDEFVYIYSPEGAWSHRLLLARVRNDAIERRDQWQYFGGWKDDEPTWTSDLDERDAVYEFPEINENGEYFGWYSWLPSVVWNPGLNLYIMVNGGTYAGHGLSGSAKDYYDNWMHTKTGSLGFWYSENPYGPWKQFFYTDYWVADHEENLTYQPKLSPKWISEDGKRMVLIWSDAMKNEQGVSHKVNYRWNQMEISISL